MDVSKLDKMKVIDLRKELETRGLDTKGVKAVLVERLRAFLEDGIGGAPGTPGTPGRRSRRTRSMTRSPSPSPVKVTAVEPNLETLAEEEDNGNSENIPAKEDVKEIISEAEATEEQNQEQEPEENNEEEHIESETVEKIEQNGEESKEEVVEEENANEEEEKQQEEEHVVDGELNKSDIEPAEEAQEDNDKQMDVDQDNEQEVDEDNEQEVDQDNEQKVDQDNEQDVDQDNGQKEEVKEASEKNNEKNLEESKTEVHRDKRSRSHSKEHYDRSHSRSRSRSHSRSRSRSRSKSRSRTPKRRSGAGSHGTPSKAEEATNPEDEPTIEDKQFGLSWFDSDLHLRIDPVTFTSAKPMSHEIYSLIWSGARTNYGVREGKVCFEVRLAEETQLGRTHQFRDEPHVRGFRVGFSLPDTTLLLGEAEHSFAYCESGRKATNSEFKEFSKPYQLDDVIGCYLDLESTPCTIKYTLNGEDVGVAFEFDKIILGENGALFPHIVTKGYEYHVNFADNENLLANVERPKRMRRIPKKEKEVEKEKDKDKNEKPKDEISKVPEEDGAKTEEGDAAKATTAIVEDEEMKEKNVADNETPESEKVVEKTEETQQTGNNDEQAEQKTSDKAENVEENGDSHTAVKDKTEDNKDGENAKETKGKEEEETDGPSPSKRKRLDDVKEKRRESSDEDEYEEIIPEPRETVALLPDYELIALIPEEKYVPGPQRPNSRKECEVILLVGLPGAGKTHWALQHIKENAEKRYHVIGADSLIAKMTIDGAPRKPLHKGRWERVYELCLHNLSPLEEIATKRRRNFILDQTNAYASAQRRKMKGFGDFKRIAVVCIPNEEELKRRNTEKTEKGNANTIRESTLNNLRANFTLPSIDLDWFDEVIYTDLSGDEAKAEVKRYNEKGKKAVDESQPNKRNRRDNRQRGDERRHRDGGGGGGSGGGGRRDFHRWNDRRVGGGGHQGGGNRWGGGGGGGGGAGYRAGWRDERGYGGGGGGGGAAAGGRGYDNRNNRYSNGPQNWGQNNRGSNRYEDRYNRSGGGGGRYDSGGGGGRYSSYGGSSGGGSGGGGGGGGGRDYRDRDHRERNAGGGGGGGGGGRRDNYRSGGDSQRDFRPGHRDNRTEDSRGGYERSGATGGAATKYGSNTNNAVASGGAHSQAGYHAQGHAQHGQYNSNKAATTGMGGGGKSSTQSGGKWSSYGQQQQSQQQQQQHHQMSSGGNWQQQAPHHQQYQQQQQQPAAQQQYWGYGDMQGYGNAQQQQTQQQQQQWGNTDAGQQQDWLAWWQQNQQQQTQANAGMGNANDANQYWSQYSYQTTMTGNGSSGGDAAGKK